MSLKTQRRAQGRRLALCLSLMAILLVSAGPLLLHAAGASRSCLVLGPPEGNLKDDARYNLELAQRLWLVAKAKKSDGSEDKGSSDTETKKDKTDSKGGKEETKPGFDKGIN